MGQINVTINQQKYTLACRDGEEDHLNELANYVDEKAKSLTENLGNLGETRLLLMSSLLICDELHDLKDKLAALEGGDNAALKDAVEERLSSVLEDAILHIEKIAPEQKTA